MRKIAIFGVPRSGTSWLSQIFNSHPDVILRFQPLFSYSHKGQLTHKATAKEIEEFFNEILLSTDDFTLMKARMHETYPEFVKSSSPTHIAFKETRYLHIIENLLTQNAQVKVVGIIRNPLATLASWLKAPKEFESDWDIFREWRMAPSKNQDKIEEFYGFDKWKQVAEEFLCFQQQFPKQFFLVHYKELNVAPLRVTDKVFDFCGLNICNQVSDFIKQSQESHDLDPYSVFRGKATDDAWKNILPSEIVEEIQTELNDTDLQKFLK